MASQTPIGIQNENLRIQAGKTAAEAKVNALKSEQRVRKDRKVLADISNNRKATLSTTLKSSSQKNKSVFRSSSNIKSSPKNCGLTEKQIRRCEEWAKEGIENVHFSGNAWHALEKAILTERVEREVQSVMSALNCWTQLSYSHATPFKQDEENEDFLDLDHDFPLPIADSHLASGKGKSSDLFLEEGRDSEPLWHCNSVEFKMKDD